MLQSRLGSFSLLRKHADRVGKDITRSKSKLLKKKIPKIKISDDVVDELLQEIIDGSFKFSPLTPVEIPKPDKPGSFRGLLVPNKKDRIVHRALLEILMPYYRGYITRYDSYGVLKGKGVQKVFADVKFLLRNNNFTHVLVADIQKFFNNINRELLGEKILSFIKDDHSIDYIVKNLFNVQFNKNPKDRSLFPDEISGIPQGCSLSPLFSDVYLKEFDLRMKESGFKIIRYIDDFIVLCRSKKETYNAFLRARKILREMKLGLDNYNQDKCKSKEISEGFNFLGVTVYSHDNILPSKEKLNSFKRKIADKVRGVCSKDRNGAIDDINSIIDGWCAAYKMCSKFNLDIIYKELNQLICIRIDRLEERNLLSKHDTLYIKRRISKFRYPERQKKA